jgi:hypothetical protein
MLLNDISLYFYEKPSRVAFQMPLKNTFNNLFWKNYQKNVIFYMSIQSSGGSRIFFWGGIFNKKN